MANFYNRGLCVLAISFMTEAVNGIHSDSAIGCLQQTTPGVRVRSCTNTSVAPTHTHTIPSRNVIIGAPPTCAGLALLTTGYNPLAVGSIYICTMNRLRIATLSALRIYVKGTSPTLLESAFDTLSPQGG